jgi:hypothetical protein
VSLGLGSVIAAAIQFAPWLAAANRYKGSVFVAVGGLLTVNYWLAIQRPRRAPCAPGENCHLDSPRMRVKRVLFWMSAGTYVIAVLASYLALLWIQVRP